MSMPTTRQDVHADYDDCGESEECRDGDRSGAVIAGSGGNGSRSLWRVTSFFTVAALGKWRMYGGGEVTRLTSNDGS